MQEDFFVGFDNDMDDFQNIVGKGKLSQKYKDLKTATGGKNIIGAGIKGALDPKKTLNKMKDIQKTRANAPTPIGSDSTPPPTTSPSDGTMAGGTSGDAITDMGSGETKSFKDTVSGLSTTAKIGIGVGALVVVGTIIFFVVRKK
jgi:hypothetical protein